METEQSGHRTRSGQDKAETQCEGDRTKREAILDCYLPDEAALLAAAAFIKLLNVKREPVKNPTESRLVA